MGVPRCNVCGWIKTDHKYKNRYDCDCKNTGGLMACPTCGLDGHEYHDGPRECVIALLAKLAAAEKDKARLDKAAELLCRMAVRKVPREFINRVRAAIDGKDVE